MDAADVDQIEPHLRSASLRQMPADVQGQNRLIRLERGSANDPEHRFVEAILNALTQESSGADVFAVDFDEVVHDDASVAIWSGGENSNGIRPARGGSVEAFRFS